jgi:hypothetical protein
MSRQFRYRVAALVLGGLLLGGPLVASGTASAEQVGGPEQEQLDEGARQVTFAGGGVLGLSCHSHPDVESMTVPADSTVRLVNQTGHDASLQLGGETKGMLPENRSTEVIFRRGTTSVTLTPTCALGNDATPVLVTAQPSASATTPDPMPAPAGGDSSASAANPSGSSIPSDSTMPGTLAAPMHSDRVSSAAGSPSATRAKAVHSAAAATTTRGTPPDRNTARLKNKVKTSRGTPGSVVHGYPGTPAGEKKALLTGVPEVDPQSAAAARPAAATVPTTEIAAAEPVAAMEPMRDQGPVGLLAVIAAVCALGVGIAAIRAFVSQRANRAEVA